MNNHLKFPNLIFRKSMNVTIRKGEKKFDFSKDLDIQDSEGNVIGDGQLIKVEYKPFYQLDSMDVMFEHDPELRNYTALFWAMTKFYPEFQEGHLVSVIYFTVDDIPKQYKEA